VFIKISRPFYLCISEWSVRVQLDSRVLGGSLMQVGDDVGWVSVGEVFGGGWRGHRSELGGYSNIVYNHHH
jgi:hypothetical protein